MLSVSPRPDAIHPIHSRPVFRAVLGNTTESHSKMCLPLSARSGTAASNHNDPYNLETHPRTGMPMGVGDRIGKNKCEIFFFNYYIYRFIKLYKTVCVLYQ